MRTMTKDSKDPSITAGEAPYLTPFKFGGTRDQMNESDCERHFKGLGEYILTYNSLSFYCLSFSCVLLSILLDFKLTCS